MTKPKFPPKLIDDGMVTYISIEEHEALIREAKARSFEIAAEIIIRQLDTKTPHAAVPLLRGRAIQIREGKDE